MCKEQAGAPKTELRVLGSPPGQQATQGTFPGTLTLKVQLNGTGW